MGEGDLYIAALVWSIKVCVCLRVEGGWSLVKGITCTLSVVGKKESEQSERREEDEWRGGGGQVDNSFKVTQVEDVQQ